MRKRDAGSVPWSEEQGRRNPVLVFSSRGRHEFSVRKRRQKVLDLC